MRVPVPRRLSRERLRTKRALWLMVGIGAVACLTVGGVWAALSAEDTNVGGSIATGTLTLNDYANYQTTTLSSSMTNIQTTINVNSDAGFPAAGNYTIQVGNEQMLVTGGQGTTTWTVTRGVNGTNATAHTTPPTVNVSTAACATIGTGTSSNINTGCDPLLGYSTSTMTYAGIPLTPTVQINDSGSIGSSDLQLWMPSCLRGVTPDASWAANTTSVSSYTGAATTGGHLAGNQTYYYEITAVVGGTEQVAGTETSYTTPVNVSTTNTITLTWPMVTGATAYKVYRSTVEGQEQLLASLGNVLTYNDTSNTAPSGSPPVGPGSGNPCGQELTTTTTDKVGDTSLTSAMVATTLNGQITSAQTSITVASSSGFPATPFTAQIENELVTVTNVTGTTWTVTRGANSTTATAHSSGVAVNQATITVAASFSSFPSSNGYMVQVGSEDMTVTSGAGTGTWIVTRGVNGTTAATHSNSAAVDQVSIPISPSTAGFPTDSNGKYRIVVYDPGGLNVEYMTVIAGQGTNTLIVNRGVNSTSATTKQSGDTVVLLDDAQFYVQESGSTTLNGGITNSQTSITVNSANGFPTVLPYTITIGTEQMRVTGGFGTNTWKVTRGYNSTTAATHNSGDAVTWNHCWYPTNSEGNCAFDPTSDLGQFAVQYPNSTQTLDLGSGQLAGNTRNLTFGVLIPSYASNSMQGTEALFTVAFYATS